MADVVIDEVWVVVVSVEFVVVDDGEEREAM